MATPTSAAPAVHASGLALVRGGCRRDVARLVSAGGRVVARGQRLAVREWGGATLDQPYVLVRIGEALVLVLVAPDAAPVMEGDLPGAPVSSS